MSIETKPDVPCAICGKALPDTELIVIMRVCMANSHPPMLDHVQCVPCHRLRGCHHPDDPELCGTLRDYRDGLLYQWWHQILDPGFWPMDAVEVEDGEAWLRRRRDRA